MTGHSDGVAPMRREAISGAVVRDPVIPEGDVVDAPLEPNVCFLGSGDDFHQVLDDGVGLGSRDADDLCDKAGVEEEGLPACDGIDADQGMFGGDGITTDGAFKRTRAIGLHVC